MFCPQCGTNADDTQQYCRKCGANLKMIAKAVKVTESIGRSDRGPIPVIKNLIDQIKAASTIDEMHKAVDEMDDVLGEASYQPPVPAVPASPEPKTGGLFRRKTPAERKARLIERGMTSLFGGVAFSIVAYFFARDAILRIPPDVADRISFDLHVWIPLFWMIGLIPAMLGLGRLLAAVMIRPEHEAPPPPIVSGQTAQQLPPAPIPVSITEHTTELLEREPSTEQPVPTNERHTR